MKHLNFFNTFHIFFVILLCLELSHNASIDIQDKYKKFSGDQGLYAEKDDVEILTIDNFKDAILGSKKAWVVEFYNSWCGFCQRFAPSWKEFAEDVKGWKDLVVIAALDCSNEKNYPLCRDYEVMAYPTLRYYQEGFKEEPKEYGFALNRGSTADDHRQDLVNKLISEQREGRGKQLPNLLPYTADDTKSIFDGTSSDIKYAVLIVQQPDALIGPEITLDLHKTPNVTVGYALTNNTDLVTTLGASTFPALYVIARDQSLEHLTPNSNNRDGFIEELTKHFKSKNINVGIEHSAPHVSAVDEGFNEEDVLTQKIQKMGDVVFQVDLETALRYSLKREVGGAKEITDEKLAALRKYLQVLAKYFPFGKNGKKLLAEISAYADSHNVVSGSHIGQMVREAEREDRQVFSTSQQWLGCKGSSEQYRGYPCGLWKMFHYLTVNVADYDAGLRGNNPRLALEAMHGYIKHFFGCSDCSQHFQDMAARRELQKVSSFDESITWLWMAHNEVNKRLSGDTTEDPDYPKIQFPSKTSCPACHNDDGSWDFGEVLKYLKHMYSSINIKYLGSDTKVIYLGLEGDSTTQAGLQEEALQIQARPAGEGVADRGDEEAASAASAKDKATLMLPILVVLTVLYVKQVWI